VPIFHLLDFAPEGLQFNDFEFVIPAKLAKMIVELVSKEPEIDLEIGEKNVTVSFGDIRIVYRLIEGKYPNYRSIVPKNNDKLLIANTSDVTAALRRTSVFAMSPSSPVRLHASNSKLNMINLESDNNQFADENVAADYKNSDLVIGFATNSLMKCLETITTEDVRMSFSDPNRACLITPDDVNLGLTVLIMPLTINV
jgi:DNA polymerase-3 subunit beta